MTDELKSNEYTLNPKKKTGCNIKEHECIDCGACKYSECECNW